MRCCVLVSDVTPKPKPFQAVFISEYIAHRHFESIAAAKRAKAKYKKYAKAWVETCEKFPHDCHCPNRRRL